MQYEAIHLSFWDTGTFWVTVAVIVFLALFGGRIVRGVLAGVDARADGIRRDIDEAQRLRREAEEMLRDAERRQVETLDTARRMTEEAEARARRLAASLAREAEEQAARREAVVTERIEAASSAAVKEVRDAATTLAVEASSRLLSEMIGADDDRVAIDHAVTGVPAALGRAAA